MKKYIFISLLIHIGVASALISWSGLSVSEWTQSLLNRLNVKQANDEPLEEIQEELSEQTTIKKKVKKPEVKKTTSKTPKKKKPSVTQKLKKPPKTFVRKKTTPSTTNVKKSSAVKNAEKKDAIGNSTEETTATKQVHSQTAPPAKPEVKDRFADEKNTQVYNQKANPPEVKYNPAEDLSAIEQEISAPPSTSPQEKPPESASHTESKSTQSESSENVPDNKMKVESVAQNTSESPENRDFEEINTNPQDLEKIIKESPSQKEIKSSQILVPVPGNPEWSYPQQARQNKKEGSVFLQYFVDDTGFVDKIQLLKSSGYSILDNEALRVMARQRYQPGQSGWYRHQVDFKLKNM